MIQQSQWHIKTTVIFFAKV